MRTSCTDCPLRETCDKPCADIERLLVNEDHARIHALHRRNALQAAQRLHAEIQAAREMTSGRSVLRGRAREVFDLTYNEALSQQQIAAKLGISRRVAGHYLARAKAALNK